MQFRSRRLAIAITSAVLVAGQSLAAATPVAAATDSECGLVTGNLVANCGFEAETASWTAAGATGHIDTDASVARTGAYGFLASSWVTEAEPVSISQTVATTAGYNYEVRFFLWRGGSFASPSLRVEVAGATVPAVLNIPGGSYFPDWQLLTFGFTAADPSATLTFTFFGPWYMDDVSVYAPLPPTVTAQPASATAVAGAVQQFSANASGAYVPAVQWQESGDAGATWSAITGATSRTLSVTAAYGLNGHRYRAVFTNGSGSVTSSAATLTVVPPAVTNLSAVFASGRITVTFTPAGDPAPTHFQCMTRDQRAWVVCSSGSQLKGSAKTISVRASWDNVAWGPVAPGVVGR